MHGGRLQGKERSSCHGVLARHRAHDLNIAGVLRPVEQAAFSTRTDRDGSQFVCLCVRQPA